MAVTGSLPERKQLETVAGEEGKMMSLVWDCPGSGTPPYHRPDFQVSLFLSLLPTPLPFCHLLATLGCCALMTLEGQAARSTLPRLHGLVQFWVFALFPPFPPRWCRDVAGSVWPCDEHRVLGCRWPAERGCEFLLRCGVHASLCAAMLPGRPSPNSLQCAPHLLGKTASRLCTDCCCVVCFSVHLSI